MNYMWEVLLKGEEQGIPREQIRFQPDSEANPYREISFQDFNKSRLSEATVEVNAYYRYGAVFGNLLSEDMDKYPELRTVLFDILAHYLTQLDLRSGLSRAEYYAKFLRLDLLLGLAGHQNAVRLQSFNRRQAQLVSAAWLRIHQVGTSMQLLAQLLRELYPYSIIYLEVREKRELLIYVGKKQTAELTNQLELLQDLFVPTDYVVQIFWDLHFGLIGTDETMEIGNIMIY